MSEDMGAQAPLAEGPGCLDAEQRQDVDSSAELPRKPSMNSESSRRFISAPSVLAGLADFPAEAAELEGQRRYFNLPPILEGITDFSALADVDDDESSFLHDVAEADPFYHMRRRPAESEVSHGNPRPSSAQAVSMRPRKLYGYLASDRDGGERRDTDRIDEQRRWQQVLRPGEDA
mmetsp:Transcript_45155/g.127727  ORF Transcript_45155/g.127727 Transcript_45155/m.127727 type:complete len:176 (+) Transcript_45155:82-609(+)